MPHTLSARAWAATKLMGPSRRPALVPDHRLDVVLVGVEAQEDAIVDHHGGNGHPADALEEHQTGRDQLRPAPLNDINIVGDSFGRNAYKTTVQNGLAVIRERDEIFLRIKYTF